MIRALLNWVWSYFTLGTGPVNTTAAPPASAEVDGALMPATTIIGQLIQLANNAAPGPGDFAFTQLAAATTLSANQVINGMIQNNATGAVTHTLPTGAQIIAALPGGTNSAGSVIGRTFLMALWNTNTPTGAVTVGTTGIAGLGVLGTFTVAASAVRWFIGTVTTATNVNIASLGQIMNSASVN